MWEVHNLCYCTARCCSNGPQTTGVFQTRKALINCLHACNVFACDWCSLVMKFCTYQAANLLLPMLFQGRQSRQLTVFVSNRLQSFLYIMWSIRLLQRHTDSMKFAKPSNTMRWAGLLSSSARMVGHENLVIAWNLTFRYMTKSLSLKVSCYGAVD